MHEKYMKLALKEAEKAYKIDDVPIGAIIVKNNKVISRGYNQKENKNIATKHAEIIAIEKACKKLKTWHLEECILYTTVEPCMMCLGAIIQARISTVVYSIQNDNFGAIHTQNIKNIEVIKNIMTIESKNIIQNFFKKKRKNKYVSRETLNINFK